MSENIWKRTYFTDVTQPFQKSGGYSLQPLFRRKPESSDFNCFRIPIFAGMTILRNISYFKTEKTENPLCPL